MSGTGEEFGELCIRFETIGMTTDVEAPAAAPAVQPVHPDVVLRPRPVRYYARQPARRLHLLKRRQPDDEDDRVCGEQSRNCGEWTFGWSPAARNLPEHRDAGCNQRNR